MSEHMLSNDDLRELRREAMVLLDAIDSLNDKYPSRTFGEARIRGRIVASSMLLRDGLDELLRPPETLDTAPPSAQGDVPKGEG